MAFDPYKFKSLFPIFSQEENQSLVYLDNAATSQKPQCVLNAITDFYLRHNGNAQRASHRLARNATKMLEQTRKAAADFLGAQSENEVVFTSGATESLNIIAHGLSVFCQQDDEVLLSDSEHHANLLPWQRLSKQQGVKLQFFSAKEGVLDPSQYLSSINERTRIIALSGASNVFGRLLDVSLLAQIKKRFPRIIIVLDASQMACHVALQASQWQCDFLVCSAHKFYGPTGVGLFYARVSYLAKMPPLMVGGEMVEDVDLNASHFITGPQRFEAGTSPLSALAGLGACLQFWQAQDRTAINAYEKKLTNYLYVQLSQVCVNTSDVQLISSAENNVGIATLIITNEHFSLSDLALWLDENDIAVRVGSHCAQTLWQSVEVNYGAGKGLRISLAAYNTTEDIDRLVTAIKTFFALDYSVADGGTEDWSNIDWQQLTKVRSWQQQYKLLLQWGSQLSYKPYLRQDSFLIKGCESAVWLQHQPEGERHYFLIDSDSTIIKGLSVLLLVLLNGKTSKQIQAINLNERYQTLGLEKYLSVSRMNGFTALFNAAKECV
jgi:cysteine desulfurase / selenocysteine lyase